MTYLPRHSTIHQPRRDRQMGMLVINLSGSFGSKSMSFSAMDGGHAEAVSKAIAWLASGPMQEAIINDHRCHEDGMEPREGFAHAGKIIGQKESAT